MNKVKGKSSINELQQWISCYRHSITKETIKGIQFPKKRWFENILLKRRKKIVFPNVVPIEQIVWLLVNISKSIKWTPEVDT